MSDDYEIDLDKSVFTCNLFSLSKQRSKASAVSVSSSDVSKGIDLRPYQEAATIMEYGVTVNICPNKYMNRKKWKIYNHDQQRQILTRIEKSLRQKTPSIQLKDIYYVLFGALNLPLLSDFSYILSFYMVFSHVVSSRISGVLAL